jgi:IclR family acetate operon transcriptional repressor
MAPNVKTPASKGSARPPDAKYVLRAAERTLDILDLLAKSPNGLSLAAIAKELGMPRSSAFRYLSVIESRHYVSRLDHGDYRLGLAFLSFQPPMLRSLAGTALPVLERLRDEFGETMNLGVLAGTRVVYVEVIESSKSVRLSARQGDREFVHSSALGKAITATLPESDVRTILDVEGMPRLTSLTITSPNSFLQDLKAVRRLGYSTDMGESEEGACCIGVSIDAPSVRAAISLSCPASRFPARKVPGVAKALRVAAHEISVALEPNSNS